MRNTFSENISEHSHQVAVLSHALALIRRDILGLKGPDPDKCAVAALYHDASEILTGDLPTPIKYYNPDIKDAYKQVERIAGHRLLQMLPEQLRGAYEHYVLEDDKELEPIVKAADKLSAHIKCLEEQKAGNTEFDSAAKQTWESMKAMNLPELDWFLDNCLGAFALNLDQL
jgi:5'-deoxynucleotidase